MWLHGRNVSVSAEAISGNMLKTLRFLRGTPLNVTKGFWQD